MHNPGSSVLLLGALLGVSVLVQGKENVTTAVALDYTSCENRCVEQYFPGHECYCNSNCDQFENCCDDYYAQCKPEYVWSNKWSEFDGHSYKFFSDVRAIYRVGVVACKGYGGLLVSINSQEEEEFIRNSVLRTRTLSAYTGGTDVAKEGEWVWVDGTHMNSPTDRWHYWFPGQPDNTAGKEDCAIITNYMFWAQRKRNTEDYVWVDYSCDINPQDIQGYICEKTLACEPNPCQNGGSCYYVGVSENFRCECIPGFVGLKCEIKLVAGETWRQCGERELTTQVGFVTSPLYPRQYPPNVRCQWTINVGAGKTISISIEMLKVELSKDCFFDSLTIYDGGSSSSSRLVGPACGNLTSNTTDLSLLLPLSTSTHVALIDFRSDNSQSGHGFRLSYNADRCGRGVGDSGCGVPRTFETDCGRTEVKQGPEGVATCAWDIIVAPGNVINLTITGFRIQDTGPDCLSGGLVVYDGSVGSASVLGRACGRRFTWTTVSSTNQLFLRLDGVTWDSVTDLIIFEYTSINGATWRVVAPLVVTDVAPGGEGGLSASSTPVNTETPTARSHMWHIRATVGDSLTLNWTLFSSAWATVDIYDGHSIYSNHVTSIRTKSQLRSGQVRATTFQLLVNVTNIRADKDFRFDITYRATAWDHELSGCYRPLYTDRTNSLGTENSLVLPDEPIVVTISENAYSRDEAGYSNGLYCKWTVSGEAGELLKLAFLDFDVAPNDPGCASDGFVVYDPATMVQRGQFCGASPSMLQESLLSSTNVLDLYFYSDTRDLPRAGGKVRAIITTQDGSSCDFNQMETSSNPTLTTSCGVLLSPWFPGMVPPGYWSWTLEGLKEGEYFIVNVHYVRGPAIQGQCNQFFQIREVPVDSKTLKHYESSIIKLCEDTDLFIPKTNLKNSPEQKLTIDLNTVRSSVYQRWEFKISYYSVRVQKPPFTKAPSDACPTNYVYYRNNCYLYEQWVKRHYKPVEYNYQTTWQLSEKRCNSDNATLLTLKDQDETDFIKYQLAVPWFWDRASTSQVNHRTIYLGLANRHTEYLWNDRVQLAYSDWFQPVESWAQPIVYPDEKDKIDLLGLTSPEPKTDLGSLCTALIVRNPFHSLSWTKLPCDYPIFRAGLICKKPATEIAGNTSPEGKMAQMTPTGLSVQLSEGYLGCTSGWLLLGDICFRLDTDYAKVKAAKTRKDPSDPFPPGRNYGEAERACAASGGWVAPPGGSVPLQKLAVYLRLWRHDEEMGDIWVSEAGALCRVIQVHRRDRLSDDVRYRVVEGGCRTVGSRAYNILCYRDATVLKEECHREEFRCANRVCISVDFVCDGHNDCFDNSDEVDCVRTSRCGVGAFRCKNGKCISMSLFCDLTDNCGDNSDEEQCVMETCDRPMDFRCAGNRRECIPQRSVCDFRKDCRDASDEDGDNCDGNCRGFHCFSGLCLPSFLHHDVITDCPGVALEDEIDKSRDIGTLWGFGDEVVSVDIKNQTYQGCPASDDAQCNPGYSVCFRRADTCVYDTLVADEGTNMVVQAFCREGSHLRTACGAVECPGLFHCPASYCVPFSKVCDGRKDCPRGEDEAQCQQYTCPGMFHCKGESFCLPHEKVCDGQVHCTRYREDEKYCSVTDVLCQGYCDCVGNIATCSNVTSLPSPEDLATRTLRAIDLSNNRLTITNDTFRHLQWLGKLELRKSRISKLPINVFMDLANLFDLDLSGNDITYLDQGVFNGLISLRSLNMHGCRLDYIDSDTLSMLTSLQYLIITKNPLTDVTQDAFSKLPTLLTLSSDAFKFCCIAKHVPVCTPEPDEFSSCEDLMANYPLQVSIWVLGFFAFVGNLFVVFWRSKTDGSKVSAFFIINLGCSDFFMGIYMLIIASVDSHYRGVYITYANKWTSSGLCQVAGILAMLSSEVSVFMLTVITADRLYVILFPLKAKMRLKHARYIVAGGWSVCVILSIIPALGIPYFGDAFFGSTGVCLPFQMNNKQRPGWEYSVLIFLVLNLISFIFITVAYIIIFMHVKKASEKMGDKATSTTDDISLAKKLMLIVATDLMCWVPIILIGIIGLGGTPIPAQVSAWVAVFVLPLNSAVNPILYTMSAIDCSGRRNKKKKRPTASAMTVHTSVGETSMGGKPPNQ